jgi:FkbM family methyltransferase
MKGLIKKIIKKIPVAFTKNQRYDLQTRQAIRRICNTRSNCVDVGCHKGEILDYIRKVAPLGKHFGFEPIPSLVDKLRRKFRKTNCEILQIALSNSRGRSPFNYVITNPSYSGLKKRRYDRKGEKDIEIMVDTDLLDNIIPYEVKIDFIKIDVEGAELLVLQGAGKLIKKDKPVIVFEYGIGGSDYYEQNPSKIFLMLENYGLQLSLLERWLNNQSPLTLEEFENQYFKKLNYFFVAYPSKSG